MNPMSICRDQGLDCRRPVWTQVYLTFRTINRSLSLLVTAVPAANWSLSLLVTAVPAANWFPSLLVTAVPAAN